MYLNDDEREQVTAAVAAFHTKWRTRMLNRDCVVFACGLSCMVAIGLAVSAAIGRTVLAPGVASWWQFMALIGLLVVMNGFYFWNSWKLKKTLYQNREGHWLREIELIEVSSRDREWFLGLISSLFDGPIEGFLDLMKESPLSSLSFVSELQKYFRVQ